jgi:hypothetical protein
MTTNREKTELGLATFKDFFAQFGDPNDPHVMILLETIIKEMLNVKTVSLLGKSQQEGYQADHGAQGTVAGDVQIDGRHLAQTPTRLDQSNPETGQRQ